MKHILMVTLFFALTMFGAGLAQQADTKPQQDVPQEKQQSTAEMEQSKTDQTKKDVAIERTRRQVKMLDDIYKGGIVLITEHYVDGDEDLPAGTAFKKLFEAAKKNGWHEVRLVDATGDPSNDENVAVSDFEKRAIEQLVKGEAFVDETIVEEKKRYLLAATPIPVVMEKCTMCHANYDFEDKTQIVGALTYRVPVDE